MALVRILVDGYSLLHNWPELAPGKPRFSPAARGELIRMLTNLYYISEKHDPPLSARISEWITAVRQS